MNADGTGFTELHDFDSTNGGYPYAALVQGTDGALYGTTPGGGTLGYGTVFKLNQDGTGFTKLQDFDYYPNGGYPYAGLVQGTDGALYGTTYQGGAPAPARSSSSTRTAPASPCSTTSTSRPAPTPMPGWSRARTARSTARPIEGGTSAYGTVFKLNEDGTGFTKLHDFDYTNGANPYAALVQGADGAFYGTTSNGGPLGGGVVFRLVPSTDAGPPTVTVAAPNGGEALFAGAPFTITWTASGRLGVTDIDLDYSPNNGSVVVADCRVPEPRRRGHILSLEHRAA